MEMETESRHPHPHPAELRGIQAEICECIIKRENTRLIDLFAQHSGILNEDIYLCSNWDCGCILVLENMQFIIEESRSENLLLQIRQGGCLGDGKCHNHDNMYDDWTPTKANCQVTFNLVIVAISCRNSDAMMMLADFQCDFNKTYNYSETSISSEKIDENISPLYISVQNGWEKEFNFLMSLGVNVNISNWKRQGTALCEAIKPTMSYEVHEMEKWNKMVEKLLASKNVDVNKILHGKVPLIKAMREMNEEVFDLLLEAGANVDICDSRAKTALMYAAVDGNMFKSYIQKLIHKGANVSLRTKGGSFLSVATNYAQTENVKIAIEHGADVDETSDLTKMPPVLIATYMDQAEIVELLVKAGADVNKSNENGYNALHIASWNGRTDILRLIIQHSRIDVNYDKQTQDKNTPLALACHGRNPEAVDLLLPKGCNVNNADKDLDTPLHYASYNGMTETVDALLKNGANPGVLNNFKTSPLWNAVQEKHKEIVKLLLSRNVATETRSVGIDQHAQTDTPIPLYQMEVSPLYVAVRRGSIEIMCLLLSAGYDFSREQWLIKRDFPKENENMDNSNLINLLIRIISHPPRLLYICRNNIRRFLGGNIHEKVTLMEIPSTLKSVLLLKDLLQPAQ